ncbi:signal peptidase I [Candidatus Micrarchaeota archaeon]|nr:signal peptidase I [Candidatus Micrarchaeota archaeon]
MNKKVFELNKYQTIEKTTYALALILAVYFLLVLMLGNWSFTATVESNSMIPVLEKGDLVVIKKQSFYAEGDVIVFFDGQKFVVHRIISKDEDYYLTKGDANTQDDGFVSTQSIVGKNVFTIKKLGWLNLWLAGRN